MQFVLNGFTEAMGFRVFDFEGVRSDRTRCAFTVRIDLALSRGYGIRLQELPLLCKALLEHRSESDEKRAYTYSEEDMREHAVFATARDEAARRKKFSRRPPAADSGAQSRLPPR